MATSTAAPAFSLAPGASRAFTKPGTINGPVRNTVTATGISAGGQTASAVVSATVTGHTCTISLVKTPSATETCDGSTVSYDITVRNDSDRYTWSGTVSDPLLGISASVTLAPGESWSLSGSGVITGEVTNTASATGRFTDGRLTQASATASATVTGVTCGLSITKTPSATDVCDGTTVTYTYTVTNTGALPLTVNLVDDQLGDIDGGAGVSLAPGASQTFTATADITGPVTNTVTATGSSPGSPDAIASTEATVTGHTCTISLVKTPSATETCDGSTVSYDITVRNDSDRYTWSGTVSDPLLGISASVTLAPGESWSLSGSGVITGEVTNTASATGRFTDGRLTQASATASATVTGVTCGLSITKTPSATDVCDGTTVTYTYTVTNTGALPLTVNLVDDQLGDIDGGAGVSLAPGASQTFTATADITGPVTNTVTATGSSPGSPDAIASTEATVTGHTCTISLVKTPSATETCDGSTVSYDITVRNDSDRYTWSGTVSDPLLGISASVTLAPGESWSLSGSGVITGEVTNTASATGRFTDGRLTQASATASATVTGVTCGLSITKTPSATDVCDGTTVTYTYTVTNTGALPLTVNLVDDQLGDIDGGAGVSLAPGASQTFTATADITGPVTNTVTATGSSPGSPDAIASTEATVTGHTCTISLVKTPSATETCDGSTVSYDITVRNDSDRYTWSGTVSDPLLGISASVTLAPGESWSLSGSGVITGEVTNTASATGRFTDGRLTQASATASATVTGVTCGLSITKTPSATDVCDGTTVTYTYTVTNTGALPLTVNLVDDQLGDIDGGAGVSLAPGASQTFTATADITGPVTNTVTATGSSPGSPDAIASTEATVTGHTCTISLVKTPSATETCDGSTVSYDITVRNDSDRYTWSGTVGRSAAGHLGQRDHRSRRDGPLSVTGVITGEVTNTATATGTLHGDR